MRNTNWERWMIVGITLVVVWIIALFALVVVNAQASEGHTLTVDGVTYTPTKVVGNGPTVHYYTPGTTPSVAYTERHTWSGNGSDNLPCDGRLHWIDNSNVLTISHCTGGGETTTTSTTQVTTTTSSLPPTTTTTQPRETTTTNVPGTSTTMAGSTTTTSQAGTTTTLCGTDDPPTPCGAPQTGGGACAIAIEEGSPCVAQDIDWWLLGSGVLAGFGVGLLAGAAVLVVVVELT